MLYALDVQTGAQTWSASTGAPAHGYYGQARTGMAAGEGYLVVPAGNTLTGWKLRP